MSNNEVLEVLQMLVMKEAAHAAELKIKGIGGADYQLGRFHMAMVILAKIEGMQKNCGEEVEETHAKR